MGAQLQGYTAKYEVVNAVKKAAKIAGTSIADFIGQTMEEKVLSMGLLEESEGANIWDIIHELLEDGVPLEKIINKLELMHEVEVCNEKRN